MEDRIEGLSNQEKVYELLDKICSNLKGEQSLNKINMQRESVQYGMIIKIFSNKRVITIDSNLDKNSINLSIDDKFQWKDYEFATLYKDNSTSCANFLEQIKKEIKKTDAFLDEILEELDKL